MAVSEQVVAQGIAPDPTRPPFRVNDLPAHLRYVIFPRRSAQIGKQAGDTLVLVATQLRQWFREHLGIHGFAGRDEASSWSDRKAICEARAKAVYDQLIRLGVSSERLQLEARVDEVPLFVSIVSRQLVALILDRRSANVMN